MNYKWKFKIIMINGAIFDGVFDSERENAKDAADEFLCGGIGNGAFHAINDKSKACITCFRIEHISALEIAPA